MFGLFGLDENPSISTKTNSVTEIEPVVGYLKFVLIVLWGNGPSSLLKFFINKSIIASKYINCFYCHARYDEGGIVRCPIG